VSEQTNRLTPKDLRLLVPGLAGWASAALGIWLRPGWVGVMVCVLLALIGLFALRGRHDHALGQIVMAVGIAALIMMSVILGAEYRDQPVLTSREGSEVSVTVSLRETYTPGARSLSVTLHEVEGQTIRGTGIPAAVVGAELGERTPYGSRVMLRGYLQRSPSWENEGWSLIVRGQPDRVQPPGWFLSGSDVLRRGLLERSEALGGDGGRLLPGLAIGDTSAVDRGLVQAMRDTSLSHLVAVSGANCAIVVGIVVGFIHLLRGGVWAKLIGGTLALAGFVVLVTPEPSIIRASIMATIVLIFLALGKPLKGIPVLAMTVLIIVAANPWMALDFAFVLSVLASGGILLLVGPLTDLISVLAPRWLAIVLAIPVAAQIACQPVLILLNPVVPVWSVVANALAAPAAPMATILGMLVCVVGPLIPVLGDALAWVAWWPSAFVAFVGRFFASLTVVTVPFVSGIPGVLLMTGMAYGGAALLLLRHPAHRIWRRISGGLVSASLLVLAVGYQLPGVLTAASIPSDWVIAQCDVGQGDALLIRSDNRTVLIDTGKYPAKLSECLRLLKISHLDVAIISHFDSDHVGAWPVIADRVDQVWIGPAMERQHQEIARALESAGARVIQVSAGDQLQIGDYFLRALWPLSESFVEPGNDSSVVIALEHDISCKACVSAVFLGDLGERPQRILMGREKFGALDVVKVSHHGSRDQFEGLYRALSAEIGLIGVGDDNTYGHPTGGALDILQASGTMALRSDERGIITISPRAEGKLVIWSER
jgi:competence protein ComEC